MGLKNNKKGNIFESNQKLLEQRLKLADPFFYDKISTLLMSRGKKAKFRTKIAKGFKTVLRSQSSKMRLKDFFTLNIFKVRPLIFFRVKKLRRRTLVFPKVLNLLEKKNLGVKWYVDLIKESKKLSINRKIVETILETSVNKSKRVFSKKKSIYQLIKDNRTSIPLLKYHS